MIQLFNHQKEVYELSKDRDVYAYFLETGTGKTILALENLRYLWDEKKIDAALITAPKTVIKPVWTKTLSEVYLKTFKFYILSWIGGFSGDQERVFNRLVEPREFNRLIIFLVNTEAFSHPRIFNYVEQFCKRFKVFWIMDESTLIKSPSAKRTKKILSISHLPQYKRILSGFPVLKAPEDLYSQVTFLSDKLSGHKSFYSFRNMYTVTKHLNQHVTVSLGPRNQVRLQKLLQGFSSRILKKDCLDLPDKLRTERYVEMTAEQKSIYTKMRREGHVLLKNTNKTIFASTLLAQLEKLHQIANGFIIPKHNIDINKYAELINIIDNEIGGSQLIVWSHYTYNIEKIFQVLSDHSISCAVIYGQTSMKDRNLAINNLAAGKIQCLIANPSTIMHGLNLVTASFAVYFNNSFHLEHRIQSEDRLHRIGQTNKVTYLDLVAEDTIEHKILKTLELKHSIGAASLGDQWEDWFS